MSKILYITPKTLHQRIVFFVLLPVFFLLLGTGSVGFFYARDVILEQWGQTAVSKLQKASHLIDMRLSRPKELLLMLKENSDDGQNHQIHEFVVERLKALDGVVQVNVEWPKTQISSNHMLEKNGKTERMGRMKFDRFEALEISLPNYNANLDGQTISLSSVFKDKDNQRVGQIEVVIAFDDLIGQIIEEEWWKSNKAFLIDNGGTILLSTFHSVSEMIHPSGKKFADQDSLEKKTIEALKTKSSGTIFGQGSPPKEISGFYHLQQAPWSLVIIAPGKKVLGPVLTFRFFYFGGGVFCIFLVILFIRMTISKTTGAIKKVSDAARDIAKGNFSEPLVVQSEDEVGELTYNFNKMTKQLKERIRLKEDMTLAMEVQQNFLPQSHVTLQNTEIFGQTVYCDETGGDFFDIIEIPGASDKIVLVVGDVVGHGIGAALLMATTRALIRSRANQSGSISQIVTDVNHLLCQDTLKTQNFVTVFFMIVDIKKNEIQWVRAGHDPAIVYDSQTQLFSQLNGRGVALGFDEEARYCSDNCFKGAPGTIVIIGSDGVWDIKNPSGERFGKDNLKKIIKKSASKSSEEITKSILTQVKIFQGAASQEDDITLMTLKF